MDTVARSTILGAGIGAGLMFIFDPVRGARRRALVPDKFVRAAHKTRDAYEATQRDVGNRASGVAAELRGRFSADGASDDIIVERVRAELGRVSSHPRAIHVAANDGSVTLTGDALATEVSSIVAAVRRVRGVDDVRNELTAHVGAEGVPALQGSSSR